MSFPRIIPSIIFPILAVFDRGCGSMLIVFLLTLCGWLLMGILFVRLKN